MNKDKLAHEIKTQVDLLYDDATAETNSLSYQDVCKITDYVESRFIKAIDEVPDVVAGALNVARSYLNPSKIEAIKQLKKGLGLLLTTTGGLAVLWGIMVSLGVGASMWASIATFFAGTGIPVLGPIAIAAGIAAIAAGLYVAIKATSPESLSASAHDAIVKSVNTWAKPNEANAASEDAITALQAGSNI